MFDDTLKPTFLRNGFRALSVGTRFFLVSVLALFMSIGALIINGAVGERNERAGEVLKEISQDVGGPQTFLGPTLLVPWTIPATSTLPATHGVYVIFPAVGKADIQTKTQERRRSLFRVPTFQSDVNLSADFDLTSAPANMPVGLDWQRAELIVGASDMRGALADATITASGKTATLEPATTMTSLHYGEHEIGLLGTSANLTAQPSGHLQVAAALRFSGAQRIAVLPYGKTTTVNLRSDWRSPGFDGGSLPATRNITAQGFTATWTVPFIARGVPAAGSPDALKDLNHSEMGVSFIEPATPYQSVTRALKYAPLFLGLVFLTYLLFEVTTSRGMHLAQYLLVGLAQLIFFLLLLSLAEHTGFDIGFAIAGVATVSLLSANVVWTFASRVQAFRAAAIFTLLYGAIYMLLRLEDYALLAGALFAFSLIAAAMYLTRSIDWSRAPMQPQPSPAMPYRVGEL